MRLVIAIAGLLLVSGCAGSEPKVLEPKASPSATVTVPVPTMPAQAKENSPEGAAAFVKHYIDVFNYASNTGDVEELSRLSDPGCSGCQKYIQLNRDTYAAGGYFKDSDWTIGDLMMDFEPDETLVDAHITSPIGRYRDSKSDSEHRSAAEDTDISFGISRRPGRPWVVTQLGLGPAE